MALSIETKCLHLEDETKEEPACKHYGSLSFPIYQTATYAHPGVGRSTGFDYSRLQNPTREQLEKGLSDGSVNKIAVVERHNATGFHGTGYISGYGNIHGAVASTVAHDSHNIVVIGDNDSDMIFACEQLRRIGGGYVIISDGNVIGELPLPLGGLMSLKPARELIPELDSVIRKAYNLGVNKNIDPFITLSFMALPVIPELRITDSGVFDVTKFEFIR